jgi:general secretion pathway protein G
MRLEVRISKRQEGYRLGLAPILRSEPNCGETHASSHPVDMASSARGFTLLELMMVLTLILILASFSFPSYQAVVVRGREAVLSNDLFMMRKVIDQFTVDKHQPPTSLNDLVDAGYLRGGIPRDPFTNSDQTWVVDSADVSLGSDVTTSGIVDIHSGSELISPNGTPYSTW